MRQQIRWGKSFIREGFLLLAKFRLHRMYWWLNLVELVTWVAFTAGLLAALVAVLMHPQGWTLLAGYLAYMCVMAWVRSVHYLRGAAQVRIVDRVLTFLAAPLYALLNIGLLLPLRLWSLATLRRTNWGTRARIEVGGAHDDIAFQPHPQPHLPRQRRETAGTRGTCPRTPRRPRRRSAPSCPCATRPRRRRLRSAAGPTGSRRPHGVPSASPLHRARSFRGFCPSLRPPLRPVRPARTLGAREAAPPGVEGGRVPAAGGRRRRGRHGAVPRVARGTTAAPGAHRPLQGGHAGVRRHGPAVAGGRQHL